MKFSITKKGYEPSEVDDFVAEAEQIMLSQKERIQNLKSKVALLNRELQGYNEKKDLIMAALTEALKRSEEIEKQANLKYNLEIQRLRQFHARWTEHYDKLLLQFPATTGSVDDFNDEVDRILKDDEANLTHESNKIYNKERARLDNREREQGENADILAKNAEKSGQADERANAREAEKPPLTPLERIRIYLQNNDDVKAILGEDTDAKAENDSVLSLEEALHPKQELKEIMRDLGLLESE